MRHLNLFRISFLLLVALIVPGCTSALAPSVNTDPTALRDGDYKLDPAHATLLFKISHFGISSYVGRFNSFNAVLDFDEEDPANSSLEAIIDVTSLDVNNRTFEDVLRGPNWFDAGSFPEAKFVSKEITVTSENTGVARGDLTIRGVTRPATLDITFNGGLRNTLTTRYTIGFDASTSFKRSEFGLNRFVGLVGDEVNLEFYGEFQRQ